MAIVVPTGEVLWFTTRELSELTPRLVIPWSIFQHLAMSRRPLCGLQSWGRVGVIVIRRVAQDILDWAHSKGYMTRILETNARSAQLRGKGKGSTSRTETPKNQKVKATQVSANNDPKYVEDLAKGGAAPTGAPATTSKAAGSPPVESRSSGNREGDPPRAEGTPTTDASGDPEARQEDPQSGTASPSTRTSSSAPPTTSADGRPVAPAAHDDPPQDHPSESTSSREAESSEMPLPPTNAFRHSAVGRYFL